jgi:hypothetical protein
MHGLVGNPSHKPPRGFGGVVLLGPRVWRGRHWGGLVLVSACLTVPPLRTAGQAHTHTIEFMGEIYVNDTDLLTIMADKYNRDHLLQQAQVNLNRWASLLNATGGAINPTKCYWCMVL